MNFLTDLHTISIPLYLFLFLYFIILAIFVGFVIINFYHIIGSGTFTFVSFLFTFITAAATVALLYETFILLQGIDWQQTITIFDPTWITGLFPTSTL
jgi:hypothetical protein